jgi:hypothetical protein
MKDISELSKHQYNKLAKRSLEGHCYFFEANSLIYELKKLQLDHYSESSCWKGLLGIALNKEIIQENHIFYVKNSIYRIYDFVNKYARMVSEYYGIKKLKDWNKFKNLDTPQYSKIPTAIKESIQKLLRDDDLREILKSRHSMTHNILVKTRKDYVSYWVLPLKGEGSRTFEEWEKSSDSMLKNSIEKLSELLLETLEVICSEERVNQ